MKSILLQVSGGAVATQNFLVLLLCIIGISIVVIPWIKNNTKLATIILGFISLGVALLVLPLSKVLEHLNEMSSVQGGSLIILFIVVLIVCALGFFIVSALSTVSVIKIIGVKYSCDVLCGKDNN